MRPAIFCLVTTGMALGPGSEDDAAFARLVDAAVAAGIDLVQLREPGMPARRLLSLARAAVDRTRGTATRVIVNERADVALAAGTAGVHLGARSFPGHRLRSITPSRMLIGRSVHDPGEADAVVRQGGLDYLIAGTVFPSPSKPGARELLGVGGLARIVRAVSVPVLAIGGIGVDNLPAVAGAGAAGVAAISLFRDALAAGRLTEAVGEARQAFDRGRTIP